MKLFALALILLAGSVQADTRMKVRYTSSGESTETVVFSKGVRQRMEYSNNVVIQQPDLKRFLDVDPRAKAYMVVPASNAAAPAATPAKRGSIVIVTTTTVNTGETKQMLGRPARHIKTTTVESPAPGACDSTQRTIEFDGWYVDLPATQRATSTEGAQAACQDEYQMQSNGEPNTGFAVAYTMTVREGNKSTSTSMEVLELSTTSLDAALFDAPAGYTAASDLSDFSRKQAVAATAAAPVKPAGAVRVGLLGVVDRTNRSLNTDYLSAQLQQSLTASGLNVVRAFTMDEAKNAGADYVLTGEVTELKKSAIGQAAGKAAKVTGMLRGFGRGGAAPAPVAQQDDNEQVEAHIAYKLTPLSPDKQEITGNVTAKTGQMISLRTALTLASNVTPMLMMAQMYQGMYNLQMMNQMMAVQQQQQSMTVDNALMGMNAFSSASNAMAAQQAPPASENKAIHAGFDQLAKAVVTAAK